MLNCERKKNNLKVNFYSMFIKSGFIKFKDSIKLQNYID